MSVTRAISQGRVVLSRGFTTSRAATSVLRITCTAVPQRQFSSNTRFQKEVDQSVTGAGAPLTATRNAPSANSARSIAITKLPKRVVKADIEQFLRKAGVDVKRVQLLVDRFTFFSSGSCFIELGSEEQKKTAIKTLDGQLLHGAPVSVSPLNDTFSWLDGSKKDTRWFVDEKSAVFGAIKPLLEKRRYALIVETPVWVGSKGSGKSVTATRRDIIEKNIGPFGLEAVGALNPAWRHLKRDRSLLAHIDFASKEGADQAVEALHGKEIEGRRVWLEPYSGSPRTAKQIGNVDQGILTQLQEGGFIQSNSSGPRPEKSVV